VAHPTWGAVFAVLALCASGAATFSPEIWISWRVTLCVFLLLAGVGLQRRLPRLAGYLECAASAGLITGSAVAVYPAGLIPWWLGVGLVLLAVILSMMRLDLRSGASVVLIGLAGALHTTGISNLNAFLLPGLLIWACLWKHHRTAWTVVMLLVSVSLLRAASGDLGDLDLLLGTLAALAGLLVLPPWLAQWGSEKPAVWTSLSAVAWVGLFWLFGSLSSFPEPWRGAAALGCAGIALLLALPGVLRLWRDSESAAARATVAPLLAATAFLVAVALPFELERAWKGIGCALAVPAVAWLAVRLRNGRLRTVAVLLVGASIAWLFADRAELAKEPSELGWIYALGVPLLALSVAAWLFIGRRGFEEAP
jgi:hypothetical protein